MPGDRPSTLDALAADTPETPEMAAAHELRHAFDYALGILDPSKRLEGEQRGVRAQDRYAAAAGMRLRCHYYNP
jgi:hypothetical protein